MGRRPYIRSPATSHDFSSTTPPALRPRTLSITIVPKLRSIQTHRNLQDPDLTIHKMATSTPSTHVMVSSPNDQAKVPPTEIASRICDDTDHISSIPVEVLIDIFSHVDVRTTACARRINKFFRAVVDTHEEVIARPIIQQEQLRLEIQIEALEVEGTSFMRALCHFDRCTNAYSEFYTSWKPMVKLQAFEERWLSSHYGLTCTRWHGRPALVSLWCFKVQKALDKWDPHQVRSVEDIRHHLEKAGLLPFFQLPMKPLSTPVGGAPRLAMLGYDNKTLRYIQSRRPFGRTEEEDFPLQPQLGVVLTTRGGAEPYTARLGLPELPEESSIREKWRLDRRSGWGDTMRLRYYVREKATRDLAEDICDDGFYEPGPSGEDEYRVAGQPRSLQLAKVLEEVYVWR
ncbi:hypothetical protein LTR53_001564 [Teratosphaeriaceae sp. CCFEE 6253]|nr:hypothetical protein LTR53_001564 [Teratosphaeriaceae sp. CCFEE 6253]